MREEMCQSLSCSSCSRHELPIVTPNSTLTTINTFWETVCQMTLPWHTSFNLPQGTHRNVSTFDRVYSNSMTKDLQFSIWEGLYSDLLYYVRHLRTMSQVHHLQTKAGGTTPTCVNAIQRQRAYGQPRGGPYLPSCYCGSSLIKPAPSQCSWPRRTVSGGGLPCITCSTMTLAHANPFPSSCPRSMLG